MTCVYPSSGDRKGFENGIIMELFWFVGLRRGWEEVVLIFKEKSRDSLDMPHVNKNCCSNVTHDLTEGKD